jgi:2-dehydro-3-deoxyphosphogluconate aldolase / (4S)-4-hydroxy-2-oxoglutarate aldolase
VNTYARIVENKIVAIIRGAHPSDVIQIIHALRDGGIHVVEITMNSPKVLSVLEAATDTFGDQVVIGAGTVLDAETARAAILAGAKFILSPTTDEETIKMTKRYGIISIPGALTPTEILRAYEYGGDIIKVFPATLGPRFIKDLRGPLPQIPLLPTGGIDLDNIAQFIEAGAVGCGIGSSLVNPRQEINEESLKAITSKAKQFVSAVNHIHR